MKELIDTRFFGEIELVNEVIAEDMEALDEVIKEDIEPWTDVGNPEKLIGIPWENVWSEQQIQILVSIYGQKFMEEYYAKKAIAQMRQDETWVRENTKAEVM